MERSRWGWSASQRRITTALAVQQTPCVECGARPTVAFAHAEIQRRHGRVCERHAKSFRGLGDVLAYDDRSIGVVNLKVVKA